MVPEDYATVMLELDGGCQGVFTVSQCQPGMRNRLSFEIDTGRALWNQERPNRLWVGQRDRPSEEVVRDPSRSPPAAVGLAHYPAGHQEGWPDALRNLVADFYPSVRDAAAARASSRRLQMSTASRSRWRRSSEATRPLAGSTCRQ